MEDANEYEVGRLFEVIMTDISRIREGLPSLDKLTRNLNGNNNINSMFTHAS